MELARILLVLCVAVYGGLGLAFLLAPETMTALVDVSLGGPTADNDVRAVYGGVTLGLGVFFAVSIPRRDWYAPALGVAAVTLGAMAASRFLSIALVGPPAPIGFALQASEIVGCAAALYALQKIRGESA